LLSDIYLRKRERKIFLAMSPTKRGGKKAEDFSARNLTLNYNLESPGRLLELIPFSNVRRDDRRSQQ